MIPLHSAYIYIQYRLDFVEICLCAFRVAPVVVVVV